MSVRFFGATSDQKKIFTAMVNPSDENLLFTKKEMLTYFDNVKKLHDGVVDVTSPWLEQKNDGKFSDLEEDLYFASRLVDRKLYILNYQLKAIEYTCTKYSELDGKFATEYVKTLASLDEIFLLCDTFIIRMREKMRTIAGKDPEIEKELAQKTDEIRELHQRLIDAVRKATVTDQISNLRKDEAIRLNVDGKLVMIVRKELLDKANKRISLHGDILFESYNSLLNSVIDKLPEKLSDLKSNLRSLIVTKDRLIADYKSDNLNAYIKQWAKIIENIDANENPFSEFKDTLKVAHRMASSFVSILQNDQLINNNAKLEKLCSDYKNLMADFS